MTSLELQTVDGLTLEGRIDAPDVPKAVLVLCHPHPQMGGTMNAPLLEALTEHLVGDEWAVLRFNFRGIGRSQGSTGTGVEELKDADAALRTGAETWPELRIALAGWSFGAAVAVKAASGRDDLAACVAIAPAVRAKPGITAGLPAPSEVDLRCPTLFVVGANDEVTLPGDARRWADEAGAEMSELAASNHLFWGRYEKLAAVVAGFLNTSLDEER